MSDVEGFFQEIDRLWEPAQSGKIPLRVIGSGALMLQTDYRRATKDGDIMETLHVTPELKARLARLAGKRTPLHRRTGLYLDIVMSGLPFLPHGPRFHSPGKLNEKLRHFSIEALDVVDVIVSKLKRFSQNDSDDVRAMIDRDLAPHTRLIERFKAAVDGFSMDSRAEDIPRYIRNLHRVERDMFRAPESKIDLPGWMEG